MDRRTITTIILCFVIYMGWNKFYVEPRMPRQSADQTATGAGTAPGTPGAPATVGASDPKSSNAAVLPGGGKGVAPHKPETRELATGTGAAVFSDGASLLQDWKLKSYRVDLGNTAAAVNLQMVANSPGEVDLAFDDPNLAYLSKVQGTFSPTPTGLEWKYEDQNVRFTRTVVATEQANYLDATYNVEFKTKHPDHAFLSVNSAVSQAKDPEEKDRQLLLWSNNSLERVTLTKAKLQEIITPVKYVAAQSRYFLLAVINQSPLEAKGLIQQLDANSARASLSYPVSGNSITLPVRIYFGPKELNLLRSVDHSLEATVDFGMFTVIAYPLLWLLQHLYTFLHNYGLAIIVLTVLLKVITYPLAYKSMKSMKQMAKIQPQLQKVREKYKNDKEALNREMMALMKTNGYNPMAGCLPILLQMPIFFALYRVLYSSIELYHVPFFGWIQDLSAHDPYYITPVVMSLLMFVQQKIQPQTATDPAQQKMMQLMPLIFGAFMLALPSGLTLYMLTNALATIVQQFVLNKKLDIHAGGGGTPAVVV